MDSIRNLFSRDAVLKLRELVKASPTCMFGTSLKDIPHHVCPMHALDVDDDGSLWFFSGLDSEHAANIGEDPRVQIIFSNASDYEFLTVFGEAEIIRDAEKIYELWKPILKAWFPLGKDDPNLSVVRVDPTKVHYWDTTDGKLVVLAKILYSAVTGNMEASGIQGDLTV